MSRRNIAAAIRPDRLPRRRWTSSSTRASSSSSATGCRSRRAPRPPPSTRRSPPAPPPPPAAGAVPAADEIGYPVVVKAQVLIGGRGKAGGIKLAADRDEGKEHATQIPGVGIRGHTVHELGIEKASNIASEYYASFVFDRAAKSTLVMLSTEGGVEIEEVAERAPEKIAR